MAKSGIITAAGQPKGVAERPSITSNPSEAGIIQLLSGPHRGTEAFQGAILGEERVAKQQIRRLPQPKTDVFMISE
jgi:hypothetical protein